MNFSIRLTYTKRPAAITGLVKKATKKATLTTYSLSSEALVWLNELAKTCKLTVVAAKLNDIEPSEAKFKLHIRPYNHTKIWLIDDKAYVGSTNLSADSIINVMVEIKDKVLKTDLKLLVKDLIEENIAVETRFL